MPLERNLLRTCERELKRRGILYRKRHGSIFTTAGDPDLYFLIDGRHYEVELKRPGEEPTRLQALRLEEWAAAGATIGVVHTVDELRALIDGGGCIGGDPLCPCHDGDMCHYRGPNAWPAPPRRPRPPKQDEA